MNRKTIIWIVAGLLGAAVLVAVGIVAYHVGFDHGAGRGVGRGAGNLRGPLRGYRFGAGFGRPGVGFRPIATLVVFLIGAAIGAAIVYATGGGRRPAGTVSAGYPTTAPMGQPADRRWRQFDEWHRYAHFPAGPDDPATGATTPGQAPMAGASTPPQPPTTPAQPPQPPAESE
ncbi:MAG: hypothetical protein ABR941_05065 [Thermoleophilia bacterium]|jgi:hypothetical protein